MARPHLIDCERCGREEYALHCREALLEQFLAFRPRRGLVCMACWVALEVAAAAERDGRGNHDPRPRKPRPTEIRP